MSPTPLTFRHSVPADLPAWRELLPHEMPMDEQLLPQLPELWSALLEDDAIEARTIVSARGRIDAFGASVFLRPGLFDELIAHPPRRLAETIYRAILDGRRPLLAGREIARANSAQGVDICVLHFCERSVDLNEPIGQQLLAMGHAAFRDAHLGYNVRALLHQNFRPAHKAFQLASGMALLHEIEPGPDGARDRDETSFLVGMTRDRALAQPIGSPISVLFRSDVPRFYFAASQRRVLRAALTGASDREIAIQLDVSRDAVKAAWKRMFSRIDQAERTTDAGDGSSRRRRRLLEYVRQHPEELRPYLRPARTGQPTR